MNEADTEQTQIDRKPTKSQLLETMKRDMKAAEILQKDMLAEVEKWRDEYNGKPYGNEVKGRSQLVSRDIKRQDEWQHASVKDPFVSTPDIIKNTPITFEDRPLAEQNEKVLNYQFTRQFNRYQFMTDVIKLHYAEGTVIVKTAWKYRDKTVKETYPIYGIDQDTGEMIEIGSEEVDVIKVLANHPDAVICRLEDIFLDPTSQGDIEKAQFVIHRYETDFTTLAKSKKYKNLRKLKKSLNKDDPSPITAEDYDPEDETNFEFTDIARKKLVIHEYWGNMDMEGKGVATPIVCTWVNDVIIQLQENPFPDKQIPFLVLKNNSTPFKIYGEANAELIGDNQKLTTAIKRGIIDNMANSNNGQKGIRANTLDNLNRRRFLSGRNFEFQGSKDDFYEGGYNQLPNSVFNVLEMVNNETESMLGVKSFSGGITGGQLGPTATSARGVLDSVSVRRMDIVRNIAENLIKPMMRKWTAYNSKFLIEEEVMRITNAEYVPYDVDDVSGKIDIAIDVATAEDNAAKAQELSFMLQTLGQDSDFGLRKILYTQFAKLQRMPDLAKAIEEYEPQPDPIAQKLRELEIAKVEAEIAERQSRTQENYADREYKSAKAVQEQAKAEAINSDIDLKDLEFLRKSTGTEFNEKMEEKAADFDAKMIEKEMSNKQ